MSVFLICCLSGAGSVGKRGVCLVGCGSVHNGISFCTDF